MRLVLASASPARLATLRSAGVHPDVVVSGLDEDAYDAETPVELAQTLATAKARAVATMLTEPDAVVIGCDSVLDLDGTSFGKPADAAEAALRWKQMRGRAARLATGHWVVAVGTGAETGATAVTTVRFADVSDDEIDAYVATGEPLEVAGAFKVDGLGGAFVTGIDGDHHNVVGLSLPLLRTLLAELGIRWTDLWTT